MVSIVILNYNQKNLISVCVKGILKIGVKLDYEIIIVDNASEDGSDEAIRELSKLDKRIKFILNKKNLGFAGGNNVGLKEAKGEYILILNPDIVVLENSIEGLVKIMEEKKEIGIIGPKLLNPDKTTQFSCFRYPLWYIPFIRRTFLGKFSWAEKELDRYLMKDFDHQLSQDVDWLLGACLLMRKKMLDQIGLFDERFFLYFEDVDLCRRAKINHWRVYYYSEISMFHYYQRTSAKSQVIFSLFSKITWIHIFSAFKYFLKWRKIKSFI